MAKIQLPLCTLLCHQSLYLVTVGTLLHKMSDSYDVKKTNISRLLDNQAIYSLLFIFRPPVRSLKYDNYCKLITRSCHLDPWCSVLSVSVRKTSQTFLTANKSERRNFAAAPDRVDIPPASLTGTETFISASHPTLLQWRCQPLSNQPTWVSYINSGRVLHSGPKRWRFPSTFICYIANWDTT